MASLEEKQWPLDVFRRTARGVWEKMSVVTAAGNDEEDASSNQLDQKPIATGVPRKGCIVIKRFRLRIKLCSQNNVTTECVDGSQQEGSATTTNSEDTVAEIVRRGRCLLIKSKARIRAILLKFQSIRDCIEFSDMMMEMNPTLNSTLSSTTSETVANNSVAIYKNEGTPFEKDQAGKNDDEKQEAEEDNDEIASTIRTDALRFELQKSDVMSYISRLMQDPGFRHYVDTIQAFIQSFPGGEEMLWQTAQTQPNVSVANDEEDT